MPFEKSVDSVLEWNWIGYSININQVNCVDIFVEFAISLLILSLFVPSVISVVY